MMLWLLLLLAGSAAAQPLTISQAVKQALEQYPSTRVNEEQLKAAAAGINLARLAYLPKADAIAQVNRATRNNVYGMVLQQQVISPISGPPLNANAGTSVWGTSVGFLISWEPFDFGLRRATIAVHEKAEKRAQASLKRSRFEVAAMTADAYLTVLAAEQALRAARAGQERIATIHAVVQSLVASGLRPGIDISRTNAERAAVDNQIIQANGALQLARVSLSQLLNLPSAQLQVSRQHFLDLVPTAAAASDLMEHPAALEQAVAKDESVARLKVLERSYYPKFNTQSTFYARGTGANPDFSTGGAASGLGPNIYNWGVGFTVTYSLMDWPGIRVRKEMEAAHGRADQARYEQLLRDLETQKDKARIQIDTATQLARNAPVLLKSAHEAQDQATARYRAGLISIFEVADTQRLLAAAEIDDSLARLGIWRAQLGLAIAQGDLTSFLEKAEQP